MNEKYKKKFVFFIIIHKINNKINKIKAIIIKILNK